ncbi:hypothetical protein [Streptomyces litchfieldiae]|uniref:Lipoprotein n=1 Tax=Streptomyces litchfieldiae TaxID=3075543 RepID=A0ABU2MU58_9ACTN|nr:hypothetical protein [Streptomyces sp. DSM 44938]MDT0345185.1 hypothetical protein [Streptomyces sp. DSM 44938]
MTSDWWNAVVAGVLATVGGLLTAGCADDAAGAGGGRPAEGTMVEGADWRGVLLTSRHDELSLPGHPTVEAESLVPYEADVERFEEALPATEVFEYPGGEPETVDLSEHTRQYTELSGGGLRELLVTGFCDPSWVDGWEEEWIQVADGGSCFFDASMDLDSGEIVSFTFYGIG